ncbi:phosphoribosyltransferase-like protein [Radiomyces spectabilis]|uniref:phosphoribosyltransferase-like protein n=1 Tax=Radiomyces spectabilis TaxID=64574 RepID=UPI00221F129B|nr:phosphoribosyltransferase-like protein [Radiomyces spectabilis]KAI8388464.1 phosphoribosyltransferase-like protein [Radiomyces spectabilis]
MILFGSFSFPFYPIFFSSSFFFLFCLSMRNLIVFGGSSHPELTAAICRRLGICPGKTKLSKFSNNETSVEMHESVRERDVYIVQSGCGHVNDNLIELLVMINACKIASAKRITVVVPYFPYSRQADVPFKPSGAPLTKLPPATPKYPPEPSHQQEDIAKQVLRRLAQTSLQDQKPEEPKNRYREWVARSGRLVADLLTCAGADHIITMDLHDAQFQGFFDCPVDNLISKPLMIKYIRLHIPNYQDAVIVSPDAGGAKRATSVADRLCMDFALIHKERRQIVTQKTDLMLVGDVRGKVCILIDDIADTSYTITKAAKMLRENGATKVIALVSHALLSANAIENIDQSALDELIVSNSIPLDPHINSPKIKVFDVAPIFTEAIRRTHFGESLSMLFDTKHDLL